MPDENKSFIRELLGMVTSVTPVQWVASLIGLLTIGGIIWVVRYGGDFLRDAELVSGLIKFSVAIVAIATALILLFYLVSGSNTTEESKNFRLEFMRMVTAVTPMHWVASLIGLFTIGGMVWVIVSGADFFLNAEKARGLITFSVAIVTVAIALILVFYLIFGSGDKEDVKERFTFGKDILLVFVGILGTIMGFYYGADTVSSDKYAALAETVQTETAQRPPIGELEKKGFVALLAKDFDAASQAFADAFKINPTYHNVAEINQLLVDQKEAFAAANTAKDNAKKEEIWRSIFCNIAEKKRTLGMLPEMIAQVQKNCPALNVAPSTNTSPTNTAENTNTNTNRP